MGKQNLLSVVVADDERELLGAVCQLIDWEGIGFRLVGRASNGLDALQLVEELQPDFLLTDIHMPFISGTALAAQVKAVQPLIQVAFLSGYDEFEYAQQGIACEVIAYLLKPISMVQLGLGISMLYERVARGFEEQVALVPLHNAPKRRVALAWKNRDTLSYAARSFADFLLNEK